MDTDISPDQVELIKEFLSECRDMLDQVEPDIIELGNKSTEVNCWEVTSCNETSCTRYGKDDKTACWLDEKNNKKGTCSGNVSTNGCLSCQAFQSINGDTDTINSIFGLFHSIKGTGAFLNFNYLSKVAHAAEDLLGQVRSGEVRLHAMHVTLLCSACDFIRNTIDYIEVNFNDTGMEKEAEAIIRILKDATSHSSNLYTDLSTGIKDHKRAELSIETVEEATDDNAAEADILKLDISQDMVSNFVKEAADLLDRIEETFLTLSKNPEDPESVKTVFRDIHTFKGNCGLLGFAELETLSHKVETLLEEIKKDPSSLSEKLISILLNIVDIFRSSVTSLSNGGKETIENLGVILKQLDSASQNLELGKISIDKGVPVDIALKKQQEQKAKTNAINPGNNAIRKTMQRHDIRVSLDKLDALMELVGELIVAENMVTHNPDLEGHEFESFEKAAIQLSKITRDLQEVAMSVRMIPVENTLRKMIRLVHDLSLKSGKEIDLEITGEDTEVDKTVCELISDPLVHMVRNSVDHGIEMPDERLKAGKREKGKVSIEARHEGEEVWIIISDNGRGLNKKKILKKAISLGMIDGDGSDIPDKKIFQMIFEAGFSTAEKVTDVSGRGVGMDVVKRNLEKIKGRIEVESNEGVGTKLTLRIPLTLAIIEGMLVQVGDEVYTIPLLSIQESITVTSENISVVEGKEVIKLRKTFLPIVRLYLLHGIEPKYKKLEDGVLVVVEHQGLTFCILIDKLLGQQQTVIKPLPKYIKNVRGCSGCSIQGNGELTLIIDVGSLALLAVDRPLRN